MTDKKPHEPIEMGAPTSTFAPEEPARRNTSRLRRMQDQVQPSEGGGSPSLLQRLKAAPLDIGATRVAYEEGEVPPRSPTGAMRQHSGLVQRKISAAKVREAQAQATDDNWHKLTQEEMFKFFHSSISGLTDAEANEQLRLVGPNKITEPPRQSLLVTFILNCLGGFSLMLFGASVLAFVVFAIEKTQQDLFDVQTLALAIVLIIVILITSGFQTYQEGQADSVMASLMQMAAEDSFVVRGGRTFKIPSADLVPGDIVKVSVGEKVPADLRILEASELKVNNAPLTGENIDIKLGTEPRHETLFEAKNIARSGCTFTTGSGVAIVFATGDNTFLGKIAEATTNAETPDTLLKREVRRIIFFMSGIAVVLSGIVLGLSFGRGDKWYVAIVYVIGIVIANVPEGLLPQITVALTLTAQRMLDRGVLVTNMEIIETLGAVTVICSDKTGTITCNRMTVSHLYYGGELHKGPWTPGAKDLALYDASDPNFKQLQICATLSTEATFITFESDVLKRQARGDASETALIKFFETVQPIEEVRASNPRAGLVPFNSTNKYMVSVNTTNEATSTHRIFMKGAAERVLPRCTTWASAKGEQPLDDDSRAEIEAMVLTIAKKGERVLMFASMPYDAPEGDLTDEGGEPIFPLSGFTFTGLISLVDPPRPTVQAALDQCASAGIQVYMVTGDHPATAVAICQSLGYQLTPCEVLKRTSDQNPETTFCVVHGINDIPKFTEADWDFVFECKQAVFARTMPEQKQAIVHHLHKLGAIVAMTGDGVNDASALKVAHVGIAMGSGSAVARDAAQVVLLNDDFGAIVDGVREGRLIFENLKKCVAYVLSHLVPEVVPFLVTIVGGFPLGIQTLVILFIDLGTELFPAVMLAYEEPEDSIMLIPPRTPDQHLVTVKMMLLTYGLIGLVETFMCYWGFVWVFYKEGFSVNQLWYTNTDWATEPADFTAEDETLYMNLCLANTKYEGSCADKSQWYDYRQTALARAQAAYFLHLVWAQFGNIFCRRTQVNSGISAERMKANPRLLLGMLFSLCIGILVIYLPGLQDICKVDPIWIKYVFTGCWIIPIYVGLEELRKYLIRRDLPHHNLLYRLTVY